MVCIKCGGHINDGDIFCTSCGNIVKQNINETSLLNEDNIEVNPSSTYTEKSRNTVKKFKPIILLLIVILIIIGGSIGIKSHVKATQVKENLKLGNKYIDEGKYEEAILVFSKVIQIDPKNIEAKVNLGKAYLGANKLAEGEKILKELLQVNRANEEAYIILASIYEKRKSYTDLINILSEGIMQASVKDNLQEKFNEVIAKIKITTLTAIIDKGDKFDLPKSAQVQIDEDKFDLPTKWTLDTVDTSKLGNQKVEGTIELINKPITLSINVKPSRGNLIGNQINGGSVAYKGNTVYFANLKDEEKLYKMNIDGSDKVKLSDDKVSTINVYKDYLYYSSDSKVYRMKTDGSSREIFIKDSSRHFQIVEDNAYYTKEYEVSEDMRVPHYSPVELYSINLKDNKQALLGILPVSYDSPVVIKDGFVYANDRYSIFKENLNNLSNTIVIDSNLWNLNIIAMSDTDMYYYSMHVGNDVEAICKISISKTTQSGNANNNRIIINDSEPYVSTAFATNDKLYEVIENKLYLIDNNNPQGKMIKDIDIAAEGNLYMVKDKLCYFNNNGDLILETIN